MSLRILFLVLCFSTQLFAQRVDSGVIDLSQVDFSSRGPVLLYGDWLFEWQEFTEKFTDKTVTVPGSWHRYGHPLLGYASYGVTVILPHSHRGLSLHIPVVNAAAHVIINGERLASIGRPGPDESSYEAKFSGTLIAIPEHFDTLNIVLQVANYTYFSSGLPRTPYIDDTPSIVNAMGRTNGVENFFAGSLIALFVYQLILFALYRKGKPYLWLSLICLMVALRALIVHGGSFLLPALMPFVSWDIWKKIEFGGVYAIIAFFPLYVYHLFTDAAPKIPMWIFVAIAAVLCAITLVTPQHVYGSLLDVAHFSLLGGFVYAIYSITKAWRSGNRDARVIFFGVIASFPFILGEILKNSAVVYFNIQLNYLVELGVLVFLLFQVYLLASHYASSYREMEKLNQGLERAIAERTNELQMANTVKDRLLSVVSHDIKSPLNSLKGILQLYHRGALDEKEFQEFTRRVESDLNRTALLVDNILYWTASQLKGLPVKIERLDLHQMIHENISLVETVAAAKKLRINNNVSPSFKVNADRHILNLVLRNLLFNAIKFSYEGGSIDVGVSATGTGTDVYVKDHGKGMDQAKVTRLMEQQTLTSESGTYNEKGTGVGLALCRDYLADIGGALLVESEKEKGSKFIIRLPEHAPTEKALTENLSS